MFIYKLITKYLLPTKKSLSASFIALLSLLVTSTVVWLLLVFLSVTRGIETNWLKKLTSVHAPLRVYPTKAYYDSLYYKADAFGENEKKTLREKWEESDSEKKNQPDLVKELYWTLQDLEKTGSLHFQDYECSPALLRLQLLRKQSTSQISQMSYAVSFPQKNPTLSSILLPPSSNDLAYVVSTLRSKEALERFFLHARIEKGWLKKGSGFSWKLLEKGSYPCLCKKNGSIEQIILQKEVGSFSGFEKATLVIAKRSYVKIGEKICDLSPKTMLFWGQNAPCQIVVDQTSFQEATTVYDLRFFATTSFNGTVFSIPVFYQALDQVEFFARTTFHKKPKTAPLWAYQVQNLWHLPQGPDGATQAVILPKSYQKSHVFLGDQGHFSFIGSSFSSAQEMQLPLYVAGFYDPGMIPIGHRCIFTSQEITETIMGSSAHLSLDTAAQNGLFVWSDLHKVDPLKREIQKRLQEKGLTKYWHVETFREYPFAKELLAQFQSDRTLFMIVGIIMIVVACSNIVSMLLVLVKEKRREIAILRSLGASKTSIGAVFGLVGMILGALGSVIGTLFAIITLRYLDSFIAMLSWLQGKKAFQAAFFGDSFTYTLSADAAVFLLILTPIASLLAGLIPAIKASRMNPSKILRS